MLENGSIFLKMSTINKKILIIIFLYCCFFCRDAVLKKKRMWI